MKKILSAMTVAMLGVASVSAAINPVPSTKKVSYGTLETFEIFSPQLGRDVTVDVLLPQGYNTDTKYPVLYMHDGQNLFDASTVWNKHAWEMDDAVSKLTCTPPIVVGVYSVSESRYGDLMPTEVVEYVNPTLSKKLLSQFGDVRLKGDKYVDFLASTLKKEIDGHYSTLTDPEHTSVMGSSMGGLASFYALCRHPETFGAAACLSTHFLGTGEPNEVFPTAFAAYLLRNLPMDGKHRIYFDTGDQTIDAAYVPYFNRIMTMIEEMGMPDELFMHQFFPGDSHQENDWARRVHLPLNFLLRSKSNPAKTIEK